MLRIQNNRTFKDRVGRLYEIGRSVLPLDENANVYMVANDERYVFVRFNGPDNPEEAAVQSMCDVSCEGLANAKVLWPERVCYWEDDDMFCGFLARRIDVPERLVLLSYMNTTMGFEKEDIQRKLSISSRVATCIDAVHTFTKRFVVGVPYLDDFHVAPDGDVYYYKAYRCEWDAKKRMNGVCSAPENHIMQNELTVAGTSFSFAIIVYEMLTGEFPFSACDSDGVLNEEQLVDMILNGESIYYYEDDPHAVAIDRKLQDMSEEVAMLFRDTFDYCGCASYEDKRPSLDDWINTLNPLETSLYEQTL